MTTPTNQIMIQNDILPNNTKAPHLLIASNDTVLCEQIESYMTRQGFDVTFHQTSRATIAALEAEDIPDIILLDQNLPDINGLNLCQHLKQKVTPFFIPILVLTETMAQQEELAVRLSGADEYLTKPIIERDLLLRTMSLLRIKRQFDHLIAVNHELYHNLADRNEELQEALERQAEMKRITDEAQVLKTQIIDNVNHELRTPMLQIKSALTMLDEVITDISDDQKNKTLMAMAKQAAGRMEELILNISQLQFIENVKLAPLILRDSITMSINSIRRSWAQRKNIERIVRNEVDETHLVLADRLALSRIISLLLDNALKFSPADAPVIINVVNTDNDLVRIEIIDEGIGIAPENYERIFEAFVQVDGGITKNFSGVGVGLTAAQILANSMNTEIFVESTLGNGSIFYFSLPLTRIDESRES